MVMGALSRTVWSLLLNGAAHYDRLASILGAGNNMDNKAGQNYHSATSGITWCKSVAAVGASVSQAAKCGSAIRLLLLLFALKSGCFAQPAPPTFYARPDAIGSGRPLFDNRIFPESWMA